MKKRQRMVAMLLSLTMVFGLCTSERAVQTVKAQEAEEIRKEQAVPDLQENPAGAQTKPEQGQEEILKDTAEDIKKADDPDETMSVDKKEEVEISEESEQPDEVTAAQELAPLSASDLSNPRTEGQKVTWDCVWFGSYPQAEVVPSANDYTAVDKSILRSGDIIEDSSLYNKLQSATVWSTNNDVMIDGNKYRRMKENDATYTNSGSSYYNWLDTDAWHYFKYEPIKWRVLKVNGNQAFLLSDIALDDQKYNTELESITWEVSTIRSWLNGYGASSNKQGEDYSSKNFIGSAFSGNERSAIVNTSVANDDNIDHGTEGGNNTIDKIFLLSESEAYGDSAATHGFVSSRYTYDEARRSKSSTYAKAMGTYSYTSSYTSDEYAYKGNCYWWLRSPGYNTDYVAYVNYSGYVDGYGFDVLYLNEGVRVALNLNLSSNLHTYAGTVSSDEKENNQEETPGGGAQTPGDGAGSSGSGSNTGTQAGDDKNIRVTKIILSGISKRIAAGKKIKLTADITPSNASNKAVTWTSSNSKVATVSSSGVVTMKKKSGGKSVTITATAQDGSGKKAAYKITSMKGTVKKVTVSGKKSLSAGKTLKLKAKVTATKKANKKLKWTSSNKKYATVSSSGKVKALKAGKGQKVKITAMATDGSGKKKTVTIKIK